MTEKGDWCAAKARRGETITTRATCSLLTPRRHLHSTTWSKELMLDKQIKRNSVRYVHVFMLARRYHNGTILSCTEADTDQRQWQNMWVWLPLATFTGTKFVSDCNQYLNMWEFKPVSAMSALTLSRRFTIVMLLWMGGFYCRLRV